MIVVKENSTNPDKIRTGWRELEFISVQLSLERDGPWLSVLANREFGETDIADANALVTVGSVNLKNEPDEQTGQVVHAREIFYGQLLGWHSEKHPLAAAYMKLKTRSLPPPITTVIGTQRVLYEEGIDALKTIGDYGGVLTQASEAVRTRIRILTDHDINPRKVIRTKAEILGYAAENINAKIENFITLGMDAAKIINNYPQVLGLTVELVRQKAANLESHGISLAKIIKNHGALVFTMRTKAVDAKIKYLTNYGLDAARILTAQPSILSLTEATINGKVANLKSLGIDAVEAINRQPSILTYAEATLRRKTRILDLMLRTLGADFKGADILGNVVTSSESKVMAVARFVADHGRAEVLGNTKSTAQILLSRPIHSHVAAIATGSYSPTSIRVQYETVPAAERRRHVLELLSSEVVRQRLGDKSIHAYFRNVPLGSEERETYLDIPRRFVAPTSNA